MGDRLLQLAQVRSRQAGVGFVAAVVPLPAGVELPAGADRLVIDRWGRRRWVPADRIEPIAGGSHLATRAQLEEWQRASREVDDG